MIIDCYVHSLYFIFASFRYVNILLNIYSCEERPNCSALKINISYLFMEHFAFT